MESQSLGYFLVHFNLPFPSTAQPPKCEMEPKFQNMSLCRFGFFSYEFLYKVIFPTSLGKSARRGHVETLPRLNGNFRKLPGSFPNLSVFLRLPFGLVCGGPPCSLFVWLCTSVHRRHEMFPRGNESNPKVRCSNVITENFVSCFALVVSQYVTISGDLYLGNLI